MMHALGPDLLPLCPTPPPGGYTATPDPAAVTCPDCRALLEGYTRREHADGLEHGYPREQVAREHRRRLIDAGGRASLLAFDPARELYAFDELPA